MTTSILRRKVNFETLCNQLIPLNTSAKQTGNNPYRLCSLRILYAIAEERDILIEGTELNYLAEQLWQYDQVCPEWLDRLKLINEITVKRLSHLSRSSFFVFSALHGVDLRQHPQPFSYHETIIFTFITLVKANAEHIPDWTTLLDDLLSHLEKSKLLYLLEKMAIDFDYLLFLQAEQLHQLIITGECTVTGVVAQQIERYQFLRAHPEAQTLERLYRTNLLEISQLIVQHPLENLVLQLPKLNPTEVVNHLGLIVPPSVDVGSYLRHELPDLVKVVDRTILPAHLPTELIDWSREKRYGYLSCLTDREILAAFSLTVPHQSRQDLVRKYEFTLYQPTFFTSYNPFFQQNLPLKHSRNTTTFLGTEIVGNLETCFVAYGLATNYQTYELEELISAFNADDDQTIEFRQPHNLSQTFNHLEILGLIEVLKLIPSPLAQDLIALIQEGLAAQTDRLNNDQLKKQLFQSFNSTEQDLIQLFLHSLFRAGMYMRRWPGPGHPYPHTEEETRRGELNEAAVNHELKSGLKLLKQMSEATREFCWQLNLCYYVQGELREKSRNLKAEWQNVAQGQECVRMSSARYIGTAVHYLKLFCHEKIPNLQLNNLELVM